MTVPLAVQKSWCRTIGPIEALGTGSAILRAPPRILRHGSKSRPRQRQDVARIRFHEFMQKREAPNRMAFPGQVFAASNIPIRVPTHFMGREDSLAGIDTTLAQHKGRIAIVCQRTQRRNSWRPGR
jgi:hypothetical protein